MPVATPISRPRRTFQQKGFPMSATLFLHAERDLAEALGIPQKKLRSVRQDDLTVDRDWATVGGEVRYSEDGRAALLAALKITPPAEHSAPKNSPGDVPPPPRAEPDGGEHGFALAPGTLAALLRPAPGTPEDLVCVKCYAPNRRMLEAKRKNGDAVLVRVKDNRNLKPGMTMKCRFAEGRMWELAQRLPRWPGKW